MDCCVPFAVYQLVDGLLRVVCNPASFDRIVACLAFRSACRMLFAIPPVYQLVVEFVACRLSALIGLLRAFENVGARVASLHDLGRIGSLLPKKTKTSATPPVRIVRVCAD